jgi:hypothetical protein
MKLEDPLETWDFFQKTAGESYVTKVDSFQTNAGSLLNNYMDINYNYININKGLKFLIFLILLYLVSSFTINNYMNTNIHILL